MGQSGVPRQDITSSSPAQCRSPNPCTTSDVSTYQSSANRHTSAHPLLHRDVYHKVSHPTSSAAFICGLQRLAKWIHSCGFRHLIIRSQLVTVVVTCALVLLLYCSVSLPRSMPTETASAHVRDGGGEAGRAFARNATQNLPDAIIIGVRKGGTRALLEFLNLHPQVEAAEDEIHYFDRPEQYDKGLQWYRQLMPFTEPGQLTIEKTPAYFITPESPSRIFQMNPNIKLILIIRDPVTRLISDYTQILSSRTAQNLSCKKFEEMAIDPITGQINLRYKAVQISLYHQHFYRWINTFKRSQIHIVDGDKLIANPAEELAKVEQFLEIEHALTPGYFYYNKTKGFYCMRKNATYEKCLGASKGRNHPEVDEKVVHRLRRFYGRYNEIFYNMSGIRFGWPTY